LIQLKVTKIQSHLLKKVNVNCQLAKWKFVRIHPIHTVWTTNDVKNLLLTVPPICTADLQICTADHNESSVIIFLNCTADLCLSGSAFFWHYWWAIRYISSFFCLILHTVVQTQMILQTFKPSELRCKKRLCPALLVIDTFFYQNINELNTHHSLMNYNELLILHYMPHFKLFKTSHSQFLPFLSQKNAQNTTYFAPTEKYCVFFCFVSFFERWAKDKNQV